MRCSSCGTENRPDASFCRSCGTALGLACPNGHPVGAGDRFCDACGAEVGAPGTEATPATLPGTEAERRLVSVLFADLVGFTSRSESRDPEEVREILSAYFDRMRQIVQRHGGVVEKFIGDAVMAVWGTPVAHEDDAERSVRAGLAMIDAVAAMNDEPAAEDGDLALRVGVLTGEAAITVGAEGQGMVAGDLVNTASRVQAAAAPGTVLVGEATRRATEAAVAYEDVGSRPMKGKTAPVPVWRALRVIAARGGTGRAQGLEAPFVGRDGELRLVKELFHSTASEGKARLVSVVGIAGIGKSRLSWEFEKYLDGLVDTVRWHRGRCLAYGEGVTYWALAEMVRMRAGIAEEEDAASATAKLREAIENHVADADERRWIEPRLAHLLGVEDRTATDREDLFSAWRLFFERMAEDNPTLMVFEDLQWADAALLDFIEHLLEWSRDHPLFIFTLARPELSERRPNWEAGKRNFTSLYLEPLSQKAMDELLRGLVPGLPDGLRERIRDRAEGVPLYAVETVRMLIDRGLLQREGDAYRPAGEVSTLDVPETLHALIAARLDGVSDTERKVLRDASVLGKTFNKPALAALTGLDQAELEPLLTSLVRKEFLSVQANPRSPERGQYGFLQSLVKEVAYQGLSKKERKARHLAIARYLESSWGSEEEEIVEVIASHYVDAYAEAPDAPDAQEIKAKAREMLTRAGHRATSLAASEDAQRYFEQAMALADEPSAQAELAELAGRTAKAAGKDDQARAHFEKAMALFQAEGRVAAAARVSALMAEVLWDEGHIEQGAALMEEAYRVLAGDQPDEDLATVAHQFGRLLVFTGQMERAVEPVDRALEIAETLWLPEVLSHALNTKGLILDFAKGRAEESLALMRHALQVAEDEEIPSAMFRAYTNLSVSMFGRDSFDRARDYQERGLALAQKIGDRFWEWSFKGQMAGWLVEEGEWDEALRLTAEIPDPAEVPAARFGLGRPLFSLVHLHMSRGSRDRAERLLSALADFEHAAEMTNRGNFLVARSMVLRADGRHDEALRDALEADRAWQVMGLGRRFKCEGLVSAVEAALALDDLVQAEELADRLDRVAGHRAPLSLQGRMARFRARLAAGRDRLDEADSLSKAAAGMFREAGVPFWLAVTLLEHGEWLVAQGRDGEADPLLLEARQIFERLKAQPWLDRLARAGSGLQAPATGR